MLGAVWVAACLADVKTKMYVTFLEGLYLYDDQTKLSLSIC